MRNKKTVLVIATILILIVLVVLLGNSGDAFYNNANYGVASFFYKLNYVFSKNPEILLKMYYCEQNDEKSMEIIEQITANNDYLEQLSIDEKIDVMRYYYTSLYIINRRVEFWREINGYIDSIKTTRKKVEVIKDLLLVMTNQENNSTEDYESIIEFSRINLELLNDTEFRVDKLHIIQCIIVAYKNLGNEEKSQEYYELSKEYFVVPN